MVEGGQEREPWWQLVRNKGNERTAPGSTIGDRVIHLAIDRMPVIVGGAGADAAVLRTVAGGWRKEVPVPEGKRTHQRLVMDE